MFKCEDEGLVGGSQCTSPRTRAWFTFPAESSGTILQAPHVPEHIKKDMLLDTSYIKMSATGLALVYAYLRKKCGDLRRAILALVEHQPHQHTEEPYNLATFVRKPYRCQSILTDWTTAQWSRLEMEKSAIISPAGFYPYVCGFTHMHQIVYFCVGPRDF
ncbi:hypothetical protein Aduo_009636 [Ancylostoma duodenale]